MDNHRPLGGIPARYTLRRIAEARESWERRKAAFLLAGGACTTCWDQGTVMAETDGDRTLPCPDCERGRETALARRERRLADYMRDFDESAAGFDLPSSSHPNAPLVGAIMGWAARWVDGVPTVDTREQQFLLLHGAVGVGKSQLAAEAARSLLALLDRAATFVSAPAMIDALRPGEDRDDLHFHAARKAPILVLDDLGVTPLTGFVEERTYLVIDRRYRLRLPTILTTNKDPFSANPGQSLRQNVGDRIYSRIMQRALVVNCGGPRQNLRLPPAVRP